MVYSVGNQVLSITHYPLTHYRSVTRMWAFRFATREHVNGGRKKQCGHI